MSTCTTIPWWIVSLAVVGALALALVALLCLSIGAELWRHRQSAGGASPQDDPRARE